MLTWKQSIKDFETYLRLEKSLSENSIEGYLNDVRKLEEFSMETGRDPDPASMTHHDLREFVNQAGSGGVSARTQARLISGIRAFFRFLLIDGEIKENPSSLLESPRLGLKLPEVLTIEEIDRIVDATPIPHGGCRRHPCQDPLAGVPG